MTIQDKAKEFLHDFTYPVNKKESFHNFNKYNKECAILCAKKIYEVTEVKYWLELAHEIEKL